MTTKTIDAFERARSNLSALVAELAKDKSREVGFAWQPTPDAPDTYDKLLAAYQRSERTGQPLPISNLFCERIIYQSPRVNMAMRFWHDCAHVRTKLSFTVDDELELGLWHLKQLEQRGVKQASLEYRLLEIDMLGQNYLQAVAGRFPHDQKVFVENCLVMGLHEGVLHEARLGAASGSTSV